MFPEKDDVLTQLQGWRIYYINSKKKSLNLLGNYIDELGVHFLLFSRKFGDSSARILADLKLRFPLLCIIYYNSQLKDGEFADIYQTGIDYCIIGDARQINLIKTLKKLWQSHWKRIPANMLPENDHILPQRVSRIIDFIEQQPLKALNANNLATYLDISPAYLRKAFKDYFGQSFRDYRQQLIAHYESVLLFQKHLKPGQIYSILNFKNLSAFSRSFKSRHGVSWQSYHRVERE